MKALTEVMRRGSRIRLTPSSRAFKSYSTISRTAAPMPKEKAQDFVNEEVLRELDKESFFKALLKK